MLKKGEKVVYIKQSYNGLKLNSLYTIKDIKDDSISIEESHPFWWFSTKCFTPLHKHRKSKLEKLNSISK